ncbi:MAG: NAD(P)-dependent alcohol dehydrogenase, partial [Lachnospiraceae bacterium]|nr:NAD(P)-dependent alcohol dehydrogenase [Lachnospiraceae bacterium]
MAIEAIAAGKIRIKDIVTDYFELDDIQHAMDACVENKAEIVKGVIRI